jgi:hypothetical protein
MASFTIKDIEFLSNRELIDILRSLLQELDVVASSGAHRSTTYLAVSAIEGLFGEIMKLLRIQPSTVRSAWPSDKKGNPKAITDLNLFERETVLQAEGALPLDFENLYKPVRKFRNYMHPERELKEQTPISQSVGQLALACLNAVIEKYASRRFVATQVWQVMNSLAQVPAENVIQMPQERGDRASVMVSELAAEKFREVTFRVIIPPDAIFNFVYNYFSLDRWSAARIEGREGRNGRGKDNGLLACTKWPTWAIIGRYATKSEPSHKQRQHTMRVVLDPPGTFALTVDNVPLSLQGGVDWEFDPQGKIGFMTENGLVSVTDLQVQTR